MKILLDPQIFNDQEFGGISRYYTEIFSRLSKLDNVKIEIPIVITKNVYLKESILLGRKTKRLAYLLSFLTKIGISIRKKTRKINTNKLVEAFAKKDFDLFVPTYYNPYFLDCIEEKPFVLTVYDMIHELYPQYFIGDPWNVVVNKRKLLDRATKIIAVSKNTKKDILRIYPHIAESKIEVIYHGNSIKIKENANLTLPENYILFVGSRKNYKNFVFLVHAITDLLIDNKALTLLCAGGGNFDKEEIKLLNDLQLSSQVIQKSFKDSDLGMIYKRAKCFVFPSAYEGFGIPVLESMACGCPIILTNSSSFPEVAGEAGLFYNLNDGNDLKNKIKLLLDDEQLRQSYSEKGLHQVKKFDWDEAAKQCFYLYVASVKKT